MRPDDLTWEVWAGSPKRAAVTAAGRPVLDWAVATIREVFGETWLADNAATSGHVPLMSGERWPLTNQRAIVRLLELAARVSVVRRDSGASQILDEARVIHPNSEAVSKQFNHLMLVLECAAFAAVKGWNISYEAVLPSGRRPDLWLRRRGIERLVEITTLNLDRAFRGQERWSHQFHGLIWELEARHSVEITYDVERVLDDQTTKEWLNDIEAGCRLVTDGHQPQTVSGAGCSATIYPAGTRTPGPTSSGPRIEEDLWNRVAKRLESKVRQTRGGPPAWLRIDDKGMMFFLTDWSAAPLAERLARLDYNVNIALADAPHVRGLILSGADNLASGSANDQTVWPRMDRSGSPTREQRASGPVAFERGLHGSRIRTTFIVPSRHPHVLLPAGAGLEPGLWYDEEPHWLDTTLRGLGYPPVALIAANGPQQ